MNDKLAFPQHEFAAIGRSVCLLGLCLLTGVACNESHAPAMTSSAQPAPSRAVNDTRTANGNQTTNDEPIGGDPKTGTTADSKPGAGDAPGVDQPVETPGTSRAPAPAAMKDITFDALKFDIKSGDVFERSMIPKLTEELHGKSIRIRGYILPESAYSLTDLPGFILTRDSDTCCFGPNRALCDFIIVHMNPGRSADFSDKPIAVQGVFTIEILVDPADPDGAVGAIYRLDADLAR